MTELETLNSLDTSRSPPPPPPHLLLGTGPQLYSPRTTSSCRDVIFLVLGMFSKQLFSLCLRWYSTDKPERDPCLRMPVTLTGLSGGGVYWICALVISGMCQARLFQRWTQVLRKIPHWKAVGIYQFLLFLWPCEVSGFTEGFVSQFCCCFQPCPVITGRQGGPWSVSWGMLRYPVNPRLSPQWQGAGRGQKRGQCSEARESADHCLHLNFAHAQKGRQSLELVHVVCFKWAIP